MAVDISLKSTRPGLPEDFEHSVPGHRIAASYPCSRKRYYATSKFGQALISGLKLQCSGNAEVPRNVHTNTLNELQ